MQQMFYRSPLPTKVKPGPSVLTIKPHRPWLCPVLIVLLVGLALWGSMLICQRNTYSLDQSLRTLLNESNDNLKSCEQANDNLVSQYDESNTKWMTLVQTTQASQETYNNILKNINDLQNERQDLIEELNFYKKLLLVAPQASANLALKLTVKPTENQAENFKNYFYNLVLSNFSKEPQLQQGDIQLELVGKLNGQNKRLTMKQIHPGLISSQPYKVVYFQRLLGHLQLPTQFLPETMIMRILPQGQKKTEEITFNWIDLQQQEQP